MRRHSQMTQLCLKRPQRNSSPQLTTRRPLTLLSLSRLAARHRRRQSCRHHAKRGLRHVKRGSVLSPFHLKPRVRSRSLWNPPRLPIRWQMTLEADTLRANTLNANAIQLSLTLHPSEANHTMAKQPTSILSKHQHFKCFRTIA